MRKTGGGTGLGGKTGSSLLDIILRYLEDIQDGIDVKEADFKMHSGECSEPK